MAKPGYTAGKKLYDEIQKVVVESQQASYDFVRSKFPTIGSGTLSLAFKELVRRKILRQTVKRRYVVIVNRDGTPKSEEELPVARRFRKQGRQKTAAQETNGSGTTVDDRDKLELISALAKSAGEKTARVLKAVSDDVRFAAKHRKTLSVLND